MRLDAALHVRAGLQVGVLVMDNAVDVARAILASLRALAGVPVTDHAILAGQARFPHLRSGNDAVDLVLLTRITRAATLHQGGAAITSVRMVVVRGAVAGLAHVAAHSAKRHEQLRNVLARIATSGGEVVKQPHVLLLADLASEPRDLLNGNAADGRRPLGVVLHAVVLSFQVIGEVDVFLQVFRLVVGVETDGVLVQKLPVDDVALGLVQADHLGSDAQQERRVGAGADGNPLGIEHLGGCRVDRVDGDELDARFLRADVVVARRAGGRPRRIGRVEHDGVCVQHVGTIVAHARVGAGNADGVGGIQKIGTMGSGVGGAGVPAPCQKRRKREARAVASQQKRLVAVLLLDGLELIANVADGLIPADALPFVFAAHLAVRVLRRPGLALDGILQAIGAEALLLLRLAAHTTALLRVIERVFVRVVGLLANHGTIFDHDLVHATAAAVVPARRRRPFSALRGIDGHALCVGGLKTGFRRAAGRSQTRDASHNSSRSTQETTTGNVVCTHCWFPLSAFLHCAGRVETVAGNGNANHQQGAHDDREHFLVVELCAGKHQDRGRNRSNDQARDLHGRVQARAGESGDLERQTDGEHDVDGDQRVHDRLLGNVSRTESGAQAKAHRQRTCDERKNSRGSVAPHSVAVYIDVGRAHEHDDEHRRNRADNAQSERAVLLHEGDDEVDKRQNEEDACKQHFLDHARAEVDRARADGRKCAGKAVDVRRGGDHADGEQHHNDQRNEPRTLALAGALEASFEHVGSCR